MALCSFCIGPTCRTRVSAEGLGGEALSIGAFEGSRWRAANGVPMCIELGPRAIPTSAPSRSKQGMRLPRRRTLRLPAAGPARALAGARVKCLFLFFLHASWLWPPICLCWRNEVKDENCPSVLSFARAAGRRDPGRVLANAHAIT